MKPEPRYKKGDKIGGRYQVHKALMGGMGEVYLCLDLVENYPYALKTFQQRYLTDPHRLRQAFEQEVATWVALEKHPNIVRCHWMQLLDNQPFMFLEWIAGKQDRSPDLRAWLRQGPLGLKLALEIAIDVCNGLIHAQTKQPGLVHRDLKPENILMGQGGLAKITDFGLAQIVQAARLALTREGADDSRRSLVGKQGIVGTPAYMAPEQWRGEPLDERTDIYALGCILHELLTGASPFTINFTPTTLHQWQHWLQSMQQAHERTLYPQQPNAFALPLQELLAACLAKMPTDRPTRIVDLLTRLTELYQELINQLLPPRPIPGVFTAMDYNNRAITYAALHQHSAALADYARSIKLDPNNAIAYDNRGQTYDSLQQFSEALADYNRAIGLAPDDPQSYANRGDTYANIGQYEAALADYNRAIELNPNEPKIYFNRGLTYTDLRQYEAALVNYDYAIKLDSNYAKAYYSRGSTYRALKQFDRALADHDRAIELDPNDAKAYYNRGVTYQTLKQDALALDDYTYTIKLDPQFAEAYSKRGLIYMLFEQHDQSLTDYNRAIEINPNHANVYTERGTVYVALGQYEMALTDYGLAIKFDPSYTLSYLNRGIAYHALGQHAAALADYNYVIELDPNLATAYYNRGVTYNILGQHLEALVDYDRAIDLDPNDAKIYYNRGVTYDVLGKYLVALADYIRAIRCDPNHNKAYLQLGLLWANQRMFQESLPYFEQAAQLGDQQGIQYAALTKKILETQQTPLMTPVKTAFTVFQQADSLQTMREAVPRHPLLVQADFIEAMEQIIAHAVPPADRPTFTQRLTWLRQIANTQPRSTP